MKFILTEDPDPLGYTEGKGGEWYNLSFIVEGKPLGSTRLTAYELEGLYTTIGHCLQDREVTK